MDMNKGTTRVVYLIGKYAIKLPRINRWRSFLRGILANLDEKMWYHHSPSDWKLKMCPTLCCLLGGVILIARRAEPITEAEYRDLDTDSFKPLPLDIKIINFGKFQDRIVLIDYADSTYFCSDCEHIFSCLKSS